MPLYDQVCDSCGEHEAFCPVEEREICEKCGNPCRILPSMFSVQGIVFSNAQKNEQTGKTWESNSQKRAWMKKNPHVVELHKGTKEERDFNWRIKSQMHDALGKQGMTYEEHGSALKEANRRTRVTKGKQEAKVSIDMGTAK